LSIDNWTFNRAGIKIEVENPPKEEFHPGASDKTGNMSGETLFTRGTARFIINISPFVPLFYRSLLFDCFYNYNLLKTIIQIL